MEDEDCPKGLLGHYKVVKDMYAEVQCVLSTLIANPPKTCAERVTLSTALHLQLTNFIVASRKLMQEYEEKYDSDSKCAQHNFLKFPPKEEPCHEDLSQIELVWKYYSKQNPSQFNAALIQQNNQKNLHPLHNQNKNICQTYIHYPSKRNISQIAVSWQYCNELSPLRPGSPLHNQLQAEDNSQDFRLQCQNEPIGYKQRLPLQYQKQQDSYEQGHNRLQCQNNVNSYEQGSPMQCRNEQNAYKQIVSFQCQNGSNYEQNSNEQGFPMLCNNQYVANHRPLQPSTRLTSQCQNQQYRFHNSGTSNLPSQYQNQQQQSGDFKISNLPPQYQNQQKQTCQCGRTTLSPQNQNKQMQTFECGRKNLPPQYQNQQKQSCDPERSSLTHQFQNQLNQICDSLGSNPPMQYQNQAFIAKSTNVPLQYQNQRNQAHDPGWTCLPPQHQNQSAQPCYPGVSNPLHKYQNQSNQTYDTRSRNIPSQYQNQHNQATDFERANKPLQYQNQPKQAYIVKRPNSPSRCNSPCQCKNQRNKAYDPRRSNSLPQYQNQSNQACEPKGSNLSPKYQNQPIQACNPKRSNSPSQYQNQPNQACNPKRSNSPSQYQNQPNQAHKPKGLNFPPKYQNQPIQACNPKRSNSPSQYQNQQNQACKCGRTSLPVQYQNQPKVATKSRGSNYPLQYQNQLNCFNHDSTLPHQSGYKAQNMPVNICATSSSPTASLNQLNAFEHNPPSKYRNQQNQPCDLTGSNISLQYESGRNSLKQNFLRQNQNVPNLQDKAIKPCGGPCGSPQQYRNQSNYEQGFPLKHRNEFNSSGMLEKKINKPQWKRTTSYTQFPNEDQHCHKRVVRAVIHPQPTHGFICEEREKFGAKPKMKPDTEKCSKQRMNNTSDMKMRCSQQNPSQKIYETLSEQEINEALLYKILCLECWPMLQARKQNKLKNLTANEQQPKRSTINSNSKESRARTLQNKPGQLCIPRKNKNNDLKHQAMPYNTKPRRDIKPILRCKCKPPQNHRRVKFEQCEKFPAFRKTGGQNKMLQYIDELLIEKLGMSLYSNKNSETSSTDVNQEDNIILSDESEQYEQEYPTTSNRRHTELSCRQIRKERELLNEIDSLFQKDDESLEDLYYLPSVKTSNCLEEENSKKYHSILVKRQPGNLTDGEALMGDNQNKAPSAPKKVVCFNEALNQKYEISSIYAECRAGPYVKKRKIERIRKNIQKYMMKFSQNQNPNLEEGFSNIYIPGPKITE